MITPRYDSDDDLARGLRAHEHAAFARVYELHATAVYNLCARLLLDRDEARDVTQDVFLTAYSRPPAARDVHLRAWLLRVATNGCLNRLRARRSRHDLADADALPSRTDAFAQAQDVALIERSLGALNACYRTALVLKDLQGLDTVELAEAMNVSRPAADVLVHRSRAAFRRAYAALAGDTAAPANLAAVLAPLQLPASLGALPALPPMTAVPAPTGAELVPAALSASGPAGTSVLATIGASLAAKAALAGAGAALVVGGGVAVQEARRTGPPAPPAQHAAAARHAGADADHVLSVRHHAWDARHRLAGHHLPAHDRRLATHSASEKHSGAGEIHAASDGVLMNPSSSEHRAALTSHVGGGAATRATRAGEADSHDMGGSTMDGDHRGSAASRSDSDDHQEGSAP